MEVLRNRDVFETPQPEQIKETNKVKQELEGWARKLLDFLSEGSGKAERPENGKLSFSKESEEQPLLTEFPSYPKIRQRIAQESFDGLTLTDTKHRTPEKNGSWTGERGNSKWIPDEDYVPKEKSVNPEKPYSNPDNAKLKDIMQKYDIDGIEFKNGFPVFDNLSRGTVTIENFETGNSVAKNRNFVKADIALTKEKGYTPEEVARWRRENNYTWHECEDKMTMQKVPNNVHANVPHDGGRSQ